MTLDQLLPLSAKALMEVLVNGHPIEASAIEEREYRGVSLGIPAWVERLAWKTFTKTFHRDPSTQRLRGWNVRMEQTGLDGAPVYKTLKDGAPFTFGHYEVTPPGEIEQRWGLGQSLLVDYGRGGNPLLDVTRLVRDPLVALEAGNPDRLLGFSYVDLGPLQVRTPSFFLLDAPRPLSHRATPPRGA